MELLLSGVETMNNTGFLARRGITVVLFFIGLFSLVLVSPVAEQLDRDDGNREGSSPLLTTIEPSANYAAWSRTWGGFEFDDGWGVWCNATTIYTCGWTRSHGSLTTNDMALIRWDTSGNMVWNRTFSGKNIIGNNAFDEAWDVWSDGYSVFIIGYLDYNAELVKWDGAGNMIWNRTFIDVTGYGEGVWGDGAGGVYTCGWRVVPKSLDMWAIKWNSTTGNQIWNRTWIGNQNHVAKDICCNGTTSYVVGSTNSSGAGQDDLFLVKLDSTGSISWSRTWGGAGSDVGSGVWVDGAYVYTCGSTGSFGAGSSDMVLVKWNAAGDQVWNCTWGGVSEELCFGAWGDDEGSVYTIGFTSSFGAGMSDGAIIAWNSTTGAQLWNRTRGAAYDDLMRDVTGYGTSVYTCGTRTISNSASPWMEFDLVKWEPNTRPDITHPANITYTHQTTGHNVTWAITDTTTETRSYTIRRDGILNGSGTWTSGGPVVRIVDGLAVGSYNFSIFATDGAGGSVQDDVRVTVLNAAPTITHPENVSYTYATTGHNITWTVTDASTGGTNYTIHLNDSVIETGSWASGVPVSRSIDGLAVGSYNYTITIDDGLGGFANDTVRVTVVAPPPPEPVDYTTAIIAGSASGAVAVVIISITASRKKHSQRKLDPENSRRG